MPGDTNPTPSPATSGPTGLDAAEAARRLVVDGPNRLVPEAPAHRLRRLLGPVADPMVVLLLVAAPTYFAIGEASDGVVALVALVPIIAVGWVLEARAERTLDRLRGLTAPTARVVRDGSTRDVNVEELVVGDLVWLHEGDVVPADGVLTESTQLLVDEAALTGESVPLDKVVAGPDTDGDDCRVHAGTTVLSGRAMFRVEATGPRTRYGRIGALVAEVHQPTTPLQRALGRLVRVVASLAGIACAVVIAAELAQGHGWGSAVIAGVSLAIAAVPEEFPMVYTLYLALGAWRLARERALVRRLPSVETLGSTTVICADKTGTLTHGSLAVAEVWSTDGESELLTAAVLACEPNPFDPLDLAIVEHARTRGVDVDLLHRGALVSDWPFDPAGKYLTHVWEVPGRAAPVVAAKGSIEGLLRVTAPDPDLCDRIERAHREFAQSGMRVIAVAGGARRAEATDRAADEASLRLLGLVAFSDPIRDGVTEAIADCRAAGIRVIMITGDHPATAHAVAEGLELPHAVGGVDVIATGADLDDRDDRGVAELVRSANVFARTRPEQKHLLVRALRDAGHVVAMTGDGINDAPALREADIGVAMGVRGTTVARESASMVLVDDNFATIVAAVRDGRRIVDNLVRAFAYLVAFHVPLLLASSLVPLLGRPLLLLPVHLVLLEILLHPVVALVFQADPAAPDVMRRPPRSIDAGLRLRSMGVPAALGLTLAGGVVAEYLVALAADWPADRARALAVATLLAAQPLLLLAVRSPDRPLWRSGQPFTRTLWWIVVLVALTTVAVVEVTPLAQLLQLSAFDGRWWFVVVAVAVLGTMWREPLKRSNRH